MKNFSDENFKSQKEQVIEMACSLTGLEEPVIDKIYESQKMFGKLDETIIDFFKKITEPNNFISAEDFLTEFNNVIKNLTNTNNFSKYFVATLSEYIDSIDTINLINIANEIILLKNPNALNQLKPLIDLKKEIPNLNESQKIFNSFLPEQNYIDSIELYEGLKHILGKNHKRFGFSYHIENSYNAIMDYLNTEIQQIELNNKITSTNTEFHLTLLNEMLSGNVNPIYKNISACKELIPDTQTLIFDMIVLVDCYINTNDSYLKYANNQTVLEYNNSLNLLYQNLISSLPKSKVLSDYFKNTYNKKSNSSDNECCNDIYFQKDLKTTIVNEASAISLNFKTWNINHKSAFDMANFIKSSNMEFNLKIRPILRTYITKLYQLLGVVENTKNFLTKKII